jgi:RNA polymerase sigma-70 factor, ECF subfamily
VTEYEELRPLLFSIAYRMVGSVSEAEDVVQEAFLRYHRAAEVESPKAWLSAVTTRLAIDHLRSARVRRERYVGPWLPEPLLADPSPDAARQAEVADSLSMAFLVLLESLSPVERAVFLLHEVFDYDYGEIAGIVGKSRENTRQLALRARRHVERRKPRFDASRRQRDRVARALRAFAIRLRRADLTIRPAEVNGQPGALVLDDEGGLLGVVSLDIADGVVQTIRSVVNPDKLGHLGAVADSRALLRRVSAPSESP